MIDFSPGEDIDLAVDTARRFAEEVLWPEQRGAESARAVPPAVLAQAHEIGFDRIDWPEAAGGAGLGALARVMVLEALAAGDPGATLAIETFGPTAHALLAFGGIDTLQRHARALGADPTARAVLAVDVHGHLTVEHDRISGTLPWVPADRVDLLAVLTRSGLVLVRDGIVLERVNGSGLRAAGASQCTLDGAPVLEAWQDADAARHALARARLHASALMVGQMSQAAEYSRRYAIDRVAFGKPIAHHQALAFLIVDMRAAADGARQMVREAAWRLQSGLPYAAAAGAAFLEAIDAGMMIGPNAVQILGAAGFMQDHPVEKAMRELRALGLLAGGADAARDDAWIDDDPAAEHADGDAGRVVLLASEA